MYEEQHDSNNFSLELEEDTGLVLYHCHGTECAPRGPVFVGHLATSAGYDFEIQTANGLLDVLLYNQRYIRPYRYCHTLCVASRTFVRVV